MQNLPQFIHQIEDSLAAVLYHGNIPAHRKNIVEKLSKLHTGYSQVRHDFYNLIPDKETAKAYAIYYGIINAVKVRHLLSLLPGSFQPSSVLDFGAGTGAASWAALSYFQALRSITLVEHNNSMLDIATQTINALAPDVQVLHSRLLRHLQDTDTYDLIIAANSLNELSSEECRNAFSSLLKKLSPNGYLILLEPGSLDITRQLMSLRESFLNDDFGSHDEFDIVYPCTHKNQCKLLTLPNQWCHSELTIERSEVTRMLDQALGLNKHTISFSALILKKSPALPQTDHPLYRIITTPKDNKAGTISYLCGPDYQGTVLLQKRDRSESTRHFKKLKMHDSFAWCKEFKKAEPPPHKDKN